MIAPMDAGKVARKIDAALDEHRRNAIVFAVSLVVMTPGLLMLAIFMLVLLFARMFPTSGGLPWTYVADIIAVLLIVSLFLKRGPVRRVEAMLAILTCSAIIGLSFVTAAVAPYIALGLVLLALLGRSYTPKESYYLGVGPYAGDDAFTFRDDRDRAHLAFGFAVLIPHFVMSAYGELFTISWLWRRPTIPLDAAAKVLVAAARAKTPMDHRTYDREAVAALVRLELVRVVPKGLEATLAGEDLVAAA